MIGLCQCARKRGGGFLGRNRKKKDHGNLERGRGAGAYHSEHCGTLRYVANLVSVCHVEKGSYHLSTLCGVGPHRVALYLVLQCPRKLPSGRIGDFWIDGKGLMFRQRDAHCEVRRNWITFVVPIK